MTLDVLLALARSVAATHQGKAEELAVGVLELLGEAQPCGVVEPEVVPPPGDGTHGVVVLHEATSGVYAPCDARSIAVMLLQAADEATAT